jgi:PAS domain S-box-containing protein
MDEKENTKELVVVDIKHYKKVKKALVESEERYRQLFENVPIGIYRTTPDGRIVDSNPALVKMLGYESFAELANRNLEQDYAIVNLPRADFIKRLKHDGEIIGLEAIWKKKDGSHIHVRENAKLTKTEDGQVMFEGTVEDITQSKQADEAQKIRSRQLEILNSLICSGNLADSLQELLETILKSVVKLLDFEMAAIYMFDQDSKKVVMMAQQGLPKKFMLQDKYLSISEKPFSMVLLHGRSVFTDYIGNVEPELAKKWKWQLAGSIPLVSKGRIIGALNVASRQRAVFSTADKDILELIGKEAGTLISKLQTEKALRESEKYYRTLIETSPDIIVVMDLEAKLLTINQQFLKIGGYFYDEVIGVSAFDFISGLDHIFLKKKTSAFIKKKKVSGFEYLFKKKDGLAIPLEVAASVLSDGQGRPKGIIAVGRDITERKRGEEQLRFMSSITENTSDAIMVTDTDFIITYINKVGEQFFGYTLDELEGKTPGIFNAEPLATQIQEKIYKTVASGQTYLGESLNRRKDGSTFYCEYKVMPLRDQSGKIYAYSSVQRDVSERKEAEAKLLAYQEQLRALTSEMLLVEERERRRIASELHDQIGQNLALCKLKVAALEKNLGDDALKGELTLVRRLLECSIQDARSLIFDLSPPVLYELGFAAALEWLAERIQEQFHVPVEFESRFKDPELKNDQQVILFQVVRELLINVGKHSRASQAKIILSHEGPSLKIQVNDDGVGFDASQIFAPREEKSGFGFFSMRERLNYLGGKLEVKSKPGQGSQIILTVPQKGSGSAPKRENS